MNNIQTMPTEKDNRGFSLVELIIVIAIMAILVGIVGTQVIPYLNSSREAKDQQILSSWVTGAMSAYSQNAGQCTDATYTITISNGAAAITDGAGKDQLLASFNSLTNSPKISSATFSSKLYQDIKTVKLVITPTGTDIVTTTIEMTTAANAEKIDVSQLKAK